MSGTVITVKNDRKTIEPLALSVTAPKISCISIRLGVICGHFLFSAVFVVNRILKVRISRIHCSQLGYVVMVTDVLAVHSFSKRAGLGNIMLLVGVKIDLAEVLIAPPLVRNHFNAIFSVTVYLVLL